MEIAYAFFARTASAAPEGGIDIFGADLETLHLELADGQSFARTSCFLVAFRFRQEESGRLYHLSSKLFSPTGQLIEIEQDVVAPRVEQPEEISSLAVRLLLDLVVLSGPGHYHMNVRIEDVENHSVCETEVPIQAKLRSNQ